MLGKIRKSRCSAGMRIGRSDVTQSRYSLTMDKIPHLGLSLASGHLETFESIILSSMMDH